MDTDSDMRTRLRMRRLLKKASIFLASLVAFTVTTIFSDIFLGTGISSFMGYTGLGRLNFFAMGCSALLILSIGGYCWIQAISATNFPV